MFLNSGREISEKIQILINEEVTEPVRFAVAFWGAGADYKLRGACKIICDLESGACNPNVIRNLLKRDNCVVLKVADFHAKVVIGSAGAVISSANMSTNGLGAEGADASGTIEAGYFLPKQISEYEKIAIWFDEIWGKATPISEDDLANAERKWNFRNRNFPIEYTIKTEPNDYPLSIDPYILLEGNIDSKDRLRAVKKNIFNRMSGVLPDVEHRRLGKIATWACHLLLNHAGIVLDHSAGDMEDSGPATDQWIVNRFGKQKRKETAANVAKLLNVIARDPFFSADIRCAANRVLSASPWVESDLASSPDTRST